MFQVPDMKEALKAGNLRPPSDFLISQGKVLLIFSIFLPLEK